MAAITHIDPTATIRPAEQTYQNLDTSPRCGPHLANGNLYFVFQDPTNSSIQVWRTTDGGATFAEVDAANHPTCKASVSNEENLRSYAVARKGNVLYVFYLDANSDLAFSPFDMDADAWGAEVAGGPSFAIVVPGRIETAILFAAYNPLTDNLRCVYKNDVAATPEIDFVDATFVGVWGAPVTVVTDVLNTAVFSLLDVTSSTDGMNWWTHIFFREYGSVHFNQAYSLHHRSADQNAVLGTDQLVISYWAGAHDPADFLGTGVLDNTTTSSPLPGQSALSAVSNREIVFPYGIKQISKVDPLSPPITYYVNGSDLVSVVRVIRAAPAQDPVWTVEEVYRMHGAGGNTSGLGYTTPPNPFGASAFYNSTLGYGLVVGKGDPSGSDPATNTMPQSDPYYISRPDSDTDLHVAFVVSFGLPGSFGLYFAAQYTGAAWQAPVVLYTLTQTEQDNGINGYWAIGGPEELGGAPPPPPVVVLTPCF